MTNELAVFQDRIRKVWHDGEWWFSVVDVVGVLSDAPVPRMYWADMKRHIQAEGFRELLTKLRQLKVRAADDKMYTTDCADEAAIQTISRYIRRRNRQRQRSGYIYAIQPIAGGLVKLGYATNIPRRLGQIQNMCPIPLRVIWHKAGTIDNEELLHASFATCRQYGEWFDLRGLDIPHELDRASAGHALQEARVG